MGKTLVIIESSGSKMKKLEKILGSGYIVRASKGHIKALKGNGDGIVPDEDYKMNYELIRDKMKNSSSLKKLVTGGTVDKVIIATDRDREGEAIGYHICQYLGLPVSKTERLIFNAIDKKTVLSALEAPSKIDMDVVHEQMARASIDYLIGFGISPVVSRKIGKYGLSAGRVQSVVLKMIIDREKEIEGFEGGSSFGVKGEFLYFGDKSDGGSSGGKGSSGSVGEGKGSEDGVLLVADLKGGFVEIDELRQFMSDCMKSNFVLGKLKSVKKSTKPPAPYITSSLIQDIGKRFGCNPEKVMKVAQKLYEEGRITYMRTDCAYIVPEFQSLIGDYVEEVYGSDYVELRQYQSSDKNAQEAHECIRVTDVKLERLPDDAECDNLERKVYRSIWTRTVASQMAKRLARVITVPVYISEREEQFEAKAEELLFDGYTILYKKGVSAEGVDGGEGDGGGEKNIGADAVKLLKSLKEGVEVVYDKIWGNEKRKRPPGRYDEVSITKQMESTGIGRPSTYHSMVPKLLRRDYVVIDSREVLPSGILRVLEIERDGKEIVERSEICKAVIDKKRLFPTDIGMSVSGFLDEEFDLLFDYEYTAGMESELDKVSEGKRKWKELVYESHMSFKEKADLLMGKLKAVKKEDNRRYLGEIDGKKVYTYEAKYGPVVLIGDTYLPLKSKKLVETLTLEQVEKMPKFPILLGQIEGEDVVVRDGRYGLYVVWKGKNYNVPKDVGLEMVGLEMVGEMIKEKDKKIVREFGPKLKIMNGPYGVYINWDGRFASLPEDVDPHEIDEETCIGIVKALGKAKKSSGGGKSSYKSKGGGKSGSKSGGSKGKKGWSKKK